MYVNLNTVIIIKLNKLGSNCSNILFYLQFSLIRTLSNHQQYLKSRFRMIISFSSVFNVRVLYYL